MGLRFGLGFEMGLELVKLQIWLKLGLGFDMGVRFELGWDMRFMLRFELSLG